MPLIPQPTREQKPWILSTIPQTFVLKILNQSRVVFIGKVKAIASANAYGSFDILPGHTNFVAIIFQKLILYPQIGVKQEFEIDTGILRFINNSCEVYLGVQLSEELKDLPEFDFSALETESKIKERAELET